MDNRQVGNIIELCGTVISFIAQTRPRKPYEMLPMPEIPALPEIPSFEPVVLPESPAPPILEAPEGENKALSQEQAYQTTPNVVEAPGLPSSEASGHATHERPSSGSYAVPHGELMAYQNKQLSKKLLALEEHLSQGCRIFGKPCDCCEKHPLEVEQLAEETITMVEEPEAYQAIADWARDIGPKLTGEAVTSGKHKTEYAAMARQAREFRKTLQGTRLPVDTAYVTDLAQKVVDGELSKDEALSQIREKYKGG